jgi:hypothetical protein
VNILNSRNWPSAEIEVGKTDDRCKQDCSRSSQKTDSGTRTAAFAIRIRTANDSFRFQPLTAQGTQEPAGQSKVERQQTERTGRWLCICQQAGFYLNRPLRLNRVHHPGQSQLYIGLLPFKFSGCPAAGCPL